MKKLDITAQKIVQHTLQSAMEGGPNCPYVMVLPAPPPRKAAAQTAGQKVNLTLQF